MTNYTGGEIIAKYLIKEGVNYVVGIPGHGNLTLTDAFYKNQDKLTFIQPKQEVSAVHMAIGYYRITKQPLSVLTLIGPGAIKAAKPSVIEILVNREYPFTGNLAMGWWDVPVPAYLKDRRKKYEEEIKGEK